MNTIIHPSTLTVSCGLTVARHDLGAAGRPLHLFSVSFTGPVRPAERA